MSTNPKPIVQRPSTGTSFPRHNSPKPMRVQPSTLQKIPVRNREPLRDTNTSLSIRANPSLMAQVLEPKAVAVSTSKIVRRGERGEMANSVNYEIHNQSLQRFDPLPQKIQVAPLKTRSTVQSVAKMDSGRLSFVKENQPRHQAPLKARKNSGCEEHRSAVTQLPSSSTGKLIERARQKVVEKHASRVESGVDKTFERPDLMKSVIEVTKTSFCKDPSVIRQYMSKHKPTINMLTSAFPAKVIEHRPQQQEVSFERGKI